jgi:hypothetical protein
MQLQLRLGLGSTKWKQCNGTTGIGIGTGTGIGIGTGTGTGTGTFVDTATHKRETPSTSSTTTNDSMTLYDDIVATALHHGISTIEAGLDGGDAALATAYRRHMHSMAHRMTTTTVPATTRTTTTTVPRLEILLRVGYRHETNNENDSTAYPDDVILPRENDSANTTTGTTSTMHSLHPAFLRHAVWQSRPLLELKRDFGERIALVVLLHNPETQLAAHKEQQNAVSSAASLSTMLTRAFVTLQQLCQEPLVATKSSTTGSSTTNTSTSNINNTKLIDGFGVVSNGLSLPSTHPLHLSATLVLQAARDAYQQTQSGDSDGGLALTVVQLPMNALETAGLAAARHFQHAKRNYSYLSRLKVYSMRPLTCYPDGGTGLTRHAFVLADFLQSISETSSSFSSTTHSPIATAAAAATRPAAQIWTNEMSSGPLDYDVALRNALAHFDAPDLMERDPSTLTHVERDTVQGCRLLQGILHDLDEALSRTRSWSTHQEYLYQHVIPTLYDTFDEYDDETANVLAQFFAAYHVAMQFHVARNTRQLLLHGEDNNDRTRNATAAPVTAAAAPTYSENLLPPSKRLQEFGLEFVLSQTVAPLTSDPAENVGEICNNGNEDQSWFAIDKVILGSSHPDQVRDAVAIVHRFEELVRREM